MGRFLAGLFSKQGQQTQPPAAALRVQSSLYGKVIPWLIAGVQRMPSNLIWYGDFFSVDQSSAGAQGGKGSYFANGTPAASKFYYASIAFCICEGPVAGVTEIWPHGTPRQIVPWTNQFDTTAVAVSASIFLGDHTQLPWPFVQAFRPSEAISYRGLVYVGIENFPLGPSASLPNLNWTVRAINSYPFGTTGIPDGDPSIAFTDFLTDPHRGIDFPSDLIGDQSLYQNYCLANGLLLSPVITSAIKASAHLIDQMAATNSNARWSSGKLTVIPYGDQAVNTGDVLQAVEPSTIPVTGDVNGKFLITVNHAATFVSDAGVVRTSDGVPLTKVSWSRGPAPLQYAVQNGVYKFNSNNHSLPVTISYSWATTASYVPQIQPIYDLTLDDFLPNRGSLGSGIRVGDAPLVIIRKDKAKQLTSVRIECLDRTYHYNPQTVEVKDEAAILLYGRERPGPVRQLHNICLTTVAQFAATQMLVRECIPRQYQFTVSRAFILLDVMDVVTVSDPAQNVFRQPVRITEIQENGDRTLTFTADEFPGTAAAPLYGTEAPQGYVAANAADPGPVNAPIIFEPTAELLAGAGPAVWAALSGGPNWGGCYVWVSSDGGVNYRQLPGKLEGPSRMGVTTSALPPVTVNQVGQTTDNTSVLGVDLSESGGTLLSATSADALALRTACYIDGEVIAYQTAALTMANSYNLSQLVRGAYGTEANVLNHPVGSPFARIDQGLFEFPIEAQDVGKELLIKFQSFNLYNDGLQSLAAVGTVSYKVKGTAYSSPLPTVLNVTSTTVDNRLAMAWDEIGSRDSRNGIFYEIRAGSTFDGAITLGIVAHPPFVLPAGTNTYWITGWVQPIPGIIARSEFPVSFAAANVQVTTNVIETFHEPALSPVWNVPPGTITGGGAIDGGLNAVRTGGTGNILIESVLNTIASGTYTAGAVSLTMSVAHGINPGNPFVISGATGTGADVASLNGAFLAAAGTAGTTLNYTIASGLTITTITGGNFALGSILDQGGQQNCTYDPGQIIDIGRVDTCPVYALTLATGVPVGQSILDINDFLAVQDVLGSGSAQFVNAYPEIAISQSSGGAFSPWQKFVPGKFTGQRFKVRWQLTTADPNTIAYLLDASWSVDVPDRVDHPLVNGTIPDTGLVITFTPDGAGSPAPFNGGASGVLGGLPSVVVTWSDATKTTGDFEVVTGLTLSGCTVTIKDSLAIPRTRTGANVYVYGW